MDFAWFRSSHVDYLIAIQSDVEYTVRIPCSVACSITWNAVVRAALSHYVQDLPHSKKDMFAGVKVLGVMEPEHDVIIPAEGRLKVKTMKLLHQQPQRYRAILLGPIYLLTERLMQGQLGGYLGNAKDLNALMRINVAFRRLFSSDDVWKDVPFPRKVWLGVGSQGSESELWDKVRRQQGISVACCHRLRWHSHYTSRMKLFYGKVMNMDKGLGSPHISSGAMRFLAGIVSGGNHDPDALSKILVVGAASAIKLLKQLHFLVPETATAYHYDLSCRPLLPSGVLVDIEPSPAKSNSRRLSQDPGTRVETNRQKDMLIRRLGDRRLTFVQAEYGAIGFDYATWAALTPGVQGFILVCDATSTTPHSLGAFLKSVLGELLRGGMVTVPVLLLLGLEKMNDSSTHESMEVSRLLMTEHLTNCPWYIQSYNANAAVGALREGYLGGLNWITRIILALK